MGTAPPQFLITTQTLQRLLLAATCLVSAVIAIGAWQLSDGAADPPQHDKLVWEDTNFDWLGIGPDTLVAGSPYPLSTQAFTLDLEATLPAKGDALSRWGIWLKNEDGSYTVIGINGGQYVTARLCSSLEPASIDMCQPMTEPSQGILTYWKFFHHIRPLGETNQVRIHRAIDDSSVMSLWLNNEWMWDIPIESHLTGQWGVWSSLPVTSAEWQSIRLRTAATPH